MWNEYWFSFWFSIKKQNKKSKIPKHLLFVKWKWIKKMWQLKKEKNWNFDFISILQFFSFPPFTRLAHLLLSAGNLDLFSTKNANKSWNYAHMTRILEINAYKFILSCSTSTRSEIYGLRWTFQWSHDWLNRLIDLL